MASLTYPADVGSYPPSPGGGGGGGGGTTDHRALSHRTDTNQHPAAAVQVAASAVNVDPDSASSEDWLKALDAALTGSSGGVVNVSQIATTSGSFLSVYLNDGLRENHGASEFANCVILLADTCQLVTMTSHVLGTPTAAPDGVYLCDGTQVAPSDRVYAIVANGQCQVYTDALGTVVEIAVTAIGEGTYTVQLLDGSTAVIDWSAVDDHALIFSIPDGFLYVQTEGSPVQVSGRELTFVVTAVGPVEGGAALLFFSPGQFTGTPIWLNGPQAGDVSAKEWQHVVPITTPGVFPTYADGFLVHGPFGAPEAFVTASTPGDTNRGGSPATLTVAENGTHSHVIGWPIPPEPGPVRGVWKTLTQGAGGTRFTLVAVVDSAGSFVAGTCPEALANGWGALVDDNTLAYLIETSGELSFDYPIRFASPRMPGDLPCQLITNCAGDMTGVQPAGFDGFWSLPNQSDRWLEDEIGGQFDEAIASAVIPATNVAYAGGPGRTDGSDQNVGAIIGNIEGWSDNDRTAYSVFLDPTVFDATTLAMLMGGLDPTDVATAVAAGSDAVRALTPGTTPVDGADQPTDHLGNKAGVWPGGAPPVDGNYLVGLILTTGNADPNVAGVVAWKIDALTGIWSPDLGTNLVTGGWRVRSVDGQLWVAQPTGSFGVDDVIDAQPGTYVSRPAHVVWLDKGPRFLIIVGDGSTPHPIPNGPSVVYSDSTGGDTMLTLPDPTLQVNGQSIKIVGVGTGLGLLNGTGIPALDVNPNTVVEAFAYNGAWYADGATQGLVVD